MASRSGVRETFSISLSSRSLSLAPGQDAVFDQHLAQPVRHLLVQRGARDRDDFGGHGEILYAKTPLSNQFVTL
jgi:hypothetical protein